MRKNLAAFITALSFIVLSVLFATTALAKSQKLQEESLDRIVATVNDEIVTESELDQAMRSMRMQMTQNQTAMPQEKTFREFVLNQIINKRLQLQIAKQAGVSVPDTELNKVIDNIAQSNGISVKELNSKIAAEGLSVASYTNDIRNELTIQKLQQQEIASRINITPQEVDEFMRTQHKQIAAALAPTNTNQSYHLEDILISVSDTATPDEIVKTQKIAEAIQNELQNGKKLSAITHATASVVTSNDLGWRNLDEVPSAFAKHVPTMKVHDSAGPILAGNGFHIIQLVEVRGATDKTTVTKERAQQMLFQKKMAEALDSWVSKLRSQAFIVVPT